MQTLHAAILSGTTPIQYPIIQSMAANRWIDVNNESAVTLTVGLGGRQYLIPPNTTARYAMDNTETFVQFTPNTAANGTTDTVSGTIYNEQDATPIEMERGANASDILPITSAMIADGAVIASKVATDAINTANIVPGAVTNPILAALAVANSNIQAGAVANAQLADGSVSTNKIANLSITNALIANAAVGTAQIANAAITTALIANLAVTDALISSVSASKITAGTITATVSMTSPVINGGTITGATIRSASSGNRVELSGNVVTLYSGSVSETAPAGLSIAGAGGATPALSISGPKIAGQNQPILSFNSGNGTIEVASGFLSGPTTVAQASGQSITQSVAVGGGWLPVGNQVLLVKQNPASAVCGMVTGSLYTSTVGSFLFGVLFGQASPVTGANSQQAFFRGYANNATTHLGFSGAFRIAPSLFGTNTTGNWLFRCGIYPDAVQVNQDTNDYYSIIVWESN